MVRWGASQEGPVTDVGAALLTVSLFCLRVAISHVATIRSQEYLPTLSHQETGALVQGGGPDVRSHGGVVCISCHSSRSVATAIREMVGSWC